MATGFPQDVLVLEPEGLLAARFARNGRNPSLLGLLHHRFEESPFESGPVTPALVRPEVLAEVARRIRREAGKFESASVLLPDSWFRMNLIDIPNGSDRSTPQIDLVRWAVRKTLPIRPEEIRFAWTPLSRSSAGTHLLVVGALEATLSKLEGVLREAGITPVLIEPIGLNVWNAIAARATDAAAERLFFHFSDGEFTTGVFRGPLPVFLRSRNLGGIRTLQQEILLSANYMKSRLEWNTPSECWVSGNRIDDAVLEAIEAEFEMPVRRARLSEFANTDLSEADRWESQLTGCTGVFTV